MSCSALQVAQVEIRNYQQSLAASRPTEEATEASADRLAPALERTVAAQVLEAVLVHVARAAEF